MLLLSGVYVSEHVIYAQAGSVGGVCRLYAQEFPVLSSFALRVGDWTCSCQFCECCCLLFYTAWPWFSILTNITLGGMSAVVWNAQKLFVKTVKNLTDMKKSMPGT